jgi:uncharacterized protein (DUF1697 family)
MATDRQVRTDGGSAGSDQEMRMSDTFVALIRGINVGRADRVAMADLRDLLRDLGYGDVNTLLNSGNAVFSAPGAIAEDVAVRTQEALAARLGVNARVVAISASDLAAAIAENPLSDAADDPARLLVAFLADPSDRVRLTPLVQQDWTPEALAVGTRAAYLWCPGSVARSQLSQAVGRVLGDGVTTRNWTTVLKLAALVDGPVPL